MREGHLDIPRCSLIQCGWFLPWICWANPQQILVLTTTPQEVRGRLVHDGATLEIESGVFHSALAAIVNSMVSGGATWTWWLSMSIVPGINSMSFLSKVWPSEMLWNLCPYVETIVLSSLGLEILFLFFILFFYFIFYFLIRNFSSNTKDPRLLTKNWDFPSMASTWIVCTIFFM